MLRYVSFIQVLGQLTLAHYRRFCQPLHLVWNTTQRKNPILSVSVKQRKWGVELISVHRNEIH